MRVHITDLGTRGSQARDTDSEDPASTNWNQQDQAGFDPSTRQRQYAAGMYTMRHAYAGVPRTRGVAPHSSFRSKLTRARARPTSSHQNRPQRQEFRSRGPHSRPTSRINYPWPIRGVEPQQNRQDLFRRLQAMQSFTPINAQYRPDNTRSFIEQNELLIVATLTRAFHRFGKERFEEIFNGSSLGRMIDTQCSNLTVGEIIDKMVDTEWNGTNEEMTDINEQLNEFEKNSAELGDEADEVGNNLGNHFEEQSSRHVEGPSQSNQQIGPQVGSQLGSVSHQPTGLPAQPREVFIVGATHLPFHTLPLLGEEMESTKGIFIQALPMNNGSPFGGLKYEFVVSLGVRRDEELLLHQSWQDFFSFGYEQAVRRLLEIHAKRCREEIQKGELEQAEIQRLFEGAPEEGAGQPPKAQNNQ